jgi:hypothetical protein
MKRYSIKFIILDEAPDDQDAADRLSIQLTMDFGSEGWEPVTAYPFGNNKLAVLLKKPEE